MYRGRGGFNNSNRGRGGYNNPSVSLNRANEYANQNLITVEVSGWQNATEQDFVNFISRKTKIGLINTHVNQASRLLQGSVRNMREAQDLVKCTGMRFAGQSLHIRIIDTIGGHLPNNGGVKLNTVELLRNFLRSRYNADLKMMDLQNLQNDQTLTSSGLFSNNSTTSKFFTALMKVAEKEKYVVNSVNLANNGIDDHSKWLEELALTFPDVKNLALSNNNIRKLDMFDRLKNKLNFLREIILQGNPITQDHIAMNKIISLFPRLIILDGQPVRDEQKLHTILNFPVEKKSMFFENFELSKAATSFLTSFFNFWDNNRMDLLQLYTPQSQFSYQSDSTVISYSTSLDNKWDNYNPHSRNLKKVSGEKSRMNKLNIGQESIAKTFMCLPLTKHSLSTNPERYSIETVSFPPLNGMMITIHGEFEEVGQPDQQFSEASNNYTRGHSRYGNRNNNSNKNKRDLLQKRSFDRVFIVVPGAAVGFVVASDMLCIRSYCGNKGWDSSIDNNSDLSTTPNEVAPNIASTTFSAPISSNVPNPMSGNSVLPADVANKLNPIQQELVLKIMQETRLKLEFVLMLCEQSNWDYETAGRNFTNSKAQIPPHAYV